MTINMHTSRQVLTPCIHLLFSPTGPGLVSHSFIITSSEFSIAATMISMAPKANVKPSLIGQKLKLSLLFRFWGFILGVVGYCIQGSIIPSIDYKYIAPLISLFIFPPISPFIYLYCIYGDIMMGIHKLTCQPASIQFVSNQRHSSARTQIGYRLAGQARESIVMSYEKVF